MQELDKIYDFYIFLLILTSGIGLALSYTAWTRRKAQGAIPLAILLFAVSLWSFFQIHVFLASEFERKLLYSNLRYIGIMTVPIAFYALAWDYKHRTKSLQFKQYLKFMIFPAICFEALMRNYLHNRFYTSIYMQDGILMLEEGPIFYLNMLYSYFFIARGIYLFLLAYKGSKFKHRQQALLIVIASALPLILNAVYILELIPNLYVDITPVSFLISCILFFYALFHFGLLDIVPIARDILVEEMEDVIIVLDNNKRVLDMNSKARNFILSNSKSDQNYIGKSINLLLASWPELAEAISNNDITYARINHEEDARRIYFDMSKSKLHDKRGSEIGEIIDLRNITSLEEALQEAKTAREAAENANRYKGYFLANMSHEIRTPMNAIIGIAEMLDTEKLTREEQKKYNRIIIKSAESLLSIIDDILDLSKVESGKMELENNAICLEQIIKDTVEVFQISASNRSIIISTQLDNRVPKQLLGDPVRIRQVLYNLIGNSIKFTSEGNIEIGLAYLGKDENKNLLELTIKDSGLGIPEDKLETIFESFKQADSSTTRKFGGTGLGLSIVKNLVELMGGSIRVESKLGEGSKFIIKLQLEDIEASVHTKAAEKEAAEVDIEGLKLLVAEDNNINREIISLHLKKLGCEFEIVENGKQAVEKYETNTYDAILMDVQMPEMDGLEATRIIRLMEQSSSKRTPIIALTASAMKEDIEKCLEAGMDSHISKPIKTQGLKEVLGAIFEVEEKIS